MLHHKTLTFPSVSVPIDSAKLPVEVCLIANLTPGSGNKLFFDVLNRQKEHAEFVDELDEPSAKLGGVNLELGDPTALYSFGVGPKGHPFHRHAGHRVFTAISGSAGAQLRFSGATSEEIASYPSSFVRKLHCINIPPDSLFTVRFGGETWHQFMPLQKPSTHPVFFALSCHTNELGGNLSEELYQAVVSNHADIPALTELLPDTVTSILSGSSMDWNSVPTTFLSLDTKPQGLMQHVCLCTRAVLGTICGAVAQHRQPAGFVTQTAPALAVQQQVLAPTTLLREFFQNQPIHHEDSFAVIVPAELLKVEPSEAEILLAQLLEGFLHNSPKGVSWLMKLRNTLIRPLRLRTSSLGCPVSSLLSEQTCNMFHGRFPVLVQHIEHDSAQVVLGADDRHLLFRSEVSVRIRDNNSFEFSLATRVVCRNAFGRFYMFAISRTHQRYIAPAMLKHAVLHVLSKR